MNAFCSNILLEHDVSLEFTSLSRCFKHDCVECATTISGFLQGVGYVIESFAPIGVGMGS